MPTLNASLTCAAALCLLSGCTIYLPGDSNFIPQSASSATQPGRSLPDPRFRPPFGVWEIDRVASMVAKATGREVAGSVVISEACPLAVIHGPLEAGEIRINPRAAATIPPNSWAFIFGHEFAHRTHDIGRMGQTSPEEELQADVAGAQYAIDAGFDLTAHIAWVLSHTRDQWSSSHGSLHDRASQLGARYGIPRDAVWACMNRYGAMRM